MINEIKSAFENTLIEIENKTKDHQNKHPVKNDRNVLQNKAQNSRMKLEKLVDMFDNIK